MLRIGAPAATKPRKKSIMQSFDSYVRANKHVGRIIFVSSSKSQATQEAAPREQHRSRFERGWCEMKTKKLIAATHAASIAVAGAPTASFAAVVVVAPVVHGPVFGGASFPWPVFACAGGIITAALVANARDNRELTAPEAWTCGTLFWFAEPSTTKKKRKHQLSFEIEVLRSQTRAACPARVFSFSPPLRRRYCRCHLTPIALPRVLIATKLPAANRRRLMGGT
jgi:hypothetical protein